VQTESRLRLHSLPSYRHDFSSFRDVMNQLAAEPALQDAIRLAWNSGAKEAQFTPCVLRQGSAAMFVAKHDSRRHPEEHLGLTHLRQMLIQIFHETLDELIATHNAVQPISRLPIELLATVFSFVPMQDRSQVALVCRSWQAILQDSPEIWDNVVFEVEDDTMKESLSTILNRSAKCPLHLSTEISEDVYEDVCDSLKRNMHRFLTLRVRIIHGISIEAADAVTEALCSSAAPLLRKFWIFDEADAFNRSLSLSTKLFADEAPNLRIFKGHCDINTFLGSSEVFANVKQVVFSPISTFKEENISTLTSLFPFIEELTIELDQWDESEASDHKSEGDRASTKVVVDLPQNLLSLVIIANDNTSNVPRFLRCLRWNSIRSIWVSYNEDAVSDEDGPVVGSLCHLTSGNNSGPRLPEFVSRSMTFESSTFTERSINLYFYDHGEDLDIALDHLSMTPDLIRLRQRALLDVGQNAILPPSVFQFIQRLYMTEMAFDPTIVGAQIPEMPMLTHLTIYSLRPESHTNERMCSMFIATSSNSLNRNADGDDLPPRTLSCPLLQTLRIAARAERWNESPVPTVLTPELVVAFICQYLRYEAAQLVCITFNGVDLAVTDTLEFDTMLQLAEQVQWDSRCIAHRYRSHDHLLSWH